MKILWLGGATVVETSSPLHVADVVPVPFEEPDHVVLGVHEPAPATVVQRGVQRAVVGHLGGALVRRGRVDRAGVDLEALATPV